MLPTWATVPLVAVFASLTHEVEHDRELRDQRLRAGRAGLGAAA